MIKFLSLGELDVTQKEPESMLTYMFGHFAVYKSG